LDDVADIFPERYRKRIMDDPANAPNVKKMNRASVNIQAIEDRAKIKNDEEFEAFLASVFNVHA
jgi:hypothetical protein